MLEIETGDMNKRGKAMFVLIFLAIYH